jgi:hypothetical protein
VTLKVRKNFGMMLSKLARGSVLCDERVTGCGKGKTPRPWQPNCNERQSDRACLADRHVCVAAFLPASITLSASVLGTSHTDACQLRPSQIADVDHHATVRVLTVIQIQVYSST